ncbi:MAG: AAA family ATPase, partial [Spirochaetes bacterium]|nr:AAA family ATPase [Spirochaetota bacterium]
HDARQLNAWVGRFDRLVYVSPPDKDSRLEIFSIHLADKPLEGDVELNVLADDTDGFTGAEIAAVCNEATMLAIREYVKSGKSADEESLKALKLNYRHIKDAMKKLRGQSKKETEKYQQIAENFIYQ